MALNLRFAVVGLAFAMAGCVHAARPEEQLGASEASVRTAQQMGARDIPRAALSLQLAVDELRQAKDLLDNGDNERARFELMRSKADADLALALTQSARAVGEAETARDQLRSLNGPESQQ